MGIKNIFLLIIIAFTLISCNVPTSPSPEIQPTDKEPVFLWNLTVQENRPFGDGTRDVSIPLPTSTPQLIKAIDFDRAFSSSLNIPPLNDQANSFSEEKDQAAWLFFEPAEYSAASFNTLYAAFENSGNSTWTTDYYLEFYAGVNPSNGDRIHLQTSTGPGERGTFQIPINSTDTSWKACWQMKNPEGFSFYEFCYNHGDGTNANIQSANSSGQNTEDVYFAFVKTKGSAPAKYASEEQAAELVSTSPATGHTFQAYDHYETFSVNIRNEGTETWDSSYALVFYSGYNWFHQTSFSVNGTVESGDTAVFSMPMEIIEDNDKWETCWYLSTPDGKNLSDFCFKYYTKS